MKKILFLDPKKIKFVFKSPKNFDLVLFDDESLLDLPKVLGL